MIKAVIFDFDGVIVESMDIKTQAFLHLFRKYPEDIKKKIVELHLNNGGMSRFKKFRIIYNDFLNKKLSEEEENILGKEFSKFCFNKMLSCKYVEGVKEFLEDKHKRYQFFIVSGTPHEEINLIVDKRDLRKYFKEVLGTPGSKTSHIKTILEKYQLNPLEVVFIGDAPNDYIGAEENGIKFIARIPKDGYNPFKSNSYKITYSIKDFNELERLIKRM